MRWSRHFKNTLLALALAGLIVPEANAIEIYTGRAPRRKWTMGSLRRFAAAAAACVTAVAECIGAAGRNASGRHAWPGGATPAECTEAACMAGRATRGE